MSDLYTEINNKPEPLLSKARACPVCDRPIQDEKFAAFDLGGGLQVKLHTDCMQQVLDAVEPKAETIPVRTSKSVIRKSTMPFDVERMAEDAKAEVYLRLLELGIKG